MKNQIRLRLGKAFKSLRAACGLTQWDVARNLDYTTAQFISNWERGVSLPPDEALPKLARIVRRPLGDIVEKMAEMKHAEVDAWKRSVMKLASKS